VIQAFQVDVRYLRKLSVPLEREHPAALEPSFAVEFNPCVFFCCLKFDIIFSSGCAVFQGLFTASPNATNGK
jgi:hypothetical protein